VIAAALHLCFGWMIARPPFCGYIAPRDPATGAADLAFVESVNLPPRSEV
jgi:hypothetical protein